MRYFASRKRSAAPYRVDDLNAVAFTQDALCVLAPGYDLTIEFDRDLALRKALGIEQLADADVGCHLARRAVEENPDHRHSLTRRWPRRSVHGRQKSMPPKNNARARPGRAVDSVAIVQ
jgi:hypothetical protein